VQNILALQSMLTKSYGINHLTKTDAYKHATIFVD